MRSKLITNKEVKTDLKLVIDISVSYNRRELINQVISLSAFAPPHHISYPKFLFNSLLINANPSNLILSPILFSFFDIAIWQISYIYVYMIWWKRQKLKWCWRERVIVLMIEIKASDIIVNNTWFQKRLIR